MTTPQLPPHLHTHAWSEPPTRIQLLLISKTQGEFVIQFVEAGLSIQDLGDGALENEWEKTMFGKEYEVVKSVLRTRDGKALGGG